jgi:plastocyanin
MEQNQISGGGYGKRPLWQWIVIYVIFAVVVYGLIYYFTSSKNSYAPSASTNSNTNTTPIIQPQTTTPETPAALSVTVSIKNFSFNPSTLSIKTGTKVTWVNDDTVPHTVTSDSSTLLASPTLSPGQSFSFTFAQAGSASYHCNIHPTMKGIIVVGN